MNAARRRILVSLAVIALIVPAIAIPVQRQRRAAAHEVEKAMKAKRSAGASFKRPAQSVVVRSGLPNLREKLKAGKPVTIAFIGGSITQNAGHGGFVNEVPAWISRQFSVRGIETINAGIAATGSDFGAQRVDRDVLIGKPDLVFIEFAVNDASRTCEADMERLVRKILLADPRPEIVLIYTVSSDTLPLLEKGKFPASVKQHEAIAEHYDLPTVALGYEAARRIRSGEWKWADFAPDTCHPTAAGYESYNRDIDAALPMLLDAGKPGAAPLPPPRSASLVIYPPPAKAEPLPAATAMTDANGIVAKRTDELPLIGRQWIDGPEFPSGAETRWRLECRSINVTAPANEEIGLERIGWQSQRWFDEARSFTGNTSHALAGSDTATGNFFGSSPFSEPRLVWREHAAGRYVLRVTAAGVDGKAIAAESVSGLNVVHFAGGDAMGKSVAFQSMRGDAPLNLQKDLEITVGDEIAIVFHATGYKYASLRGLRVTIGYFGPDEAK
jgi:lysophospholipase L1-like esterase